MALGTWLTFSSVCTPWKMFTLDISNIAHGSLGVGKKLMSWTTDSRIVIFWTTKGGKWEMTVVCAIKRLKEMSFKKSEFHYNSICNKVHIAAMNVWFCTHKNSNYGIRAMDIEILAPNFLIFMFVSFKLFPVWTILDLCFSLKLLSHNTKVYEVYMA